MKEHGLWSQPEQSSNPGQPLGICVNLCKSLTDLFLPPVQNLKALIGEGSEMTYGKGLVHSILRNVNYLSDFPCPHSIICFLCMWFCRKDFHVLYSLLPIPSSLFLPAPVGPEGECVSPHDGGGGMYT